MAEVIDMREGLQRRAARKARGKIEITIPERSSGYELALEATNLAREILDHHERDRRRWIDRCREEARRRRGLEAELQKIERDRFPVVDEAVLQAARQVAQSPVRARVVAEALFPGVTPSHSVVIRVGHALGRLEREGKVGRFQRVSGRRRRYGYPDGYDRGYDWQVIGA